ncbi:hypothetical protein TNCV_2688681 [Trichonephila clavipes]|nr:hypothetical protein TNCV_2688681 [Trichonephila clavipes]
MMIPAYNKKGCAAFHSRRESITGASPTSFPEENTTIPYSGYEPETTRLQVEGHIHHTGRVAKNKVVGKLPEPETGLLREDNLHLYQCIHPYPGVSAAYNAQHTSKF